MNRQSVGKQGEETAVDFLTKLGWRIVGRNLRTRMGEIDILAANGDQLVVVEVKTKRSATFGAAVEMITPRKAQTLRQLAKGVAAAYNKPVRIDVLAIDYRRGQAPTVSHYPFAVGES